MAQDHKPVWSQKYLVLKDCITGIEYKVIYTPAFDSIAGSPDYTIKLNITDTVVRCFSVRIVLQNGFGTPPPLVYDIDIDWNTQDYTIENIDCVDCIKSLNYYYFLDCNNNLYYTQHDQYDFSGLNQQDTVGIIPEGGGNLLCLIYISYSQEINPGSTPIGGAFEVTIGCLCGDATCGITGTILGIGPGFSYTEIPTGYYFGRPYYSLSLGYIWYNIFNATPRWVYTSVLFDSNTLLDQYAPGTSFLPPSGPWLNLFPTVGIISLNYLNCCYDLTDCTTNQVYHTTVDLFNQIGKVVTFSEYPGRCFTVSIGTDCTGPINVTLVDSYNDCTTCKGIYGYKLEKCDDPNTIVYTDEDLSAYIGQSVTVSEYNSDCFFVSTLDIAPANPVPITVITNHSGCLACISKRYELVNCENPLDVIVTITDLSLIVGKIIKIKGCPDKCYTVQNSLDKTSEYEIFVDEIFNTCLECNPPVQEEVKTPTNRFIKPNYNVNYCSIEKYEKISCSFADNVYKDLIEFKYGVKHCCKGDYIKSYIRYQLMMYKIKEVPDITCMDNTDCNCNCK